MYRYSLVIKVNRVDNVDTVVHRELMLRFGPAVRYTIRARLTGEAVVIVNWESHRGIQSILGTWFGEPQRRPWRERDSSYPEGTLLFYREILPGESLPSPLSAL